MSLVTFHLYGVVHQMLHLSRTEVAHPQFSVHCYDLRLTTWMCCMWGCLWNCSDTSDSSKCSHRPIERVGTHLTSREVLPPSVVKANDDDDKKRVFSVVAPWLWNCLPRGSPGVNIAILSGKELLLSQTLKCVFLLETCCYIPFPCCCFSFTTVTAVSEMLDSSDW